MSTLPDERIATGAELKRLRKKLGMNQAHVAKAVGVSRTLVTMWERGKCDISYKHSITLNKLLAAGRTDDEHLLIHAEMNTLADE